MEPANLEYIVPAGLVNITTTATSFAMTLTRASAIYSVALDDLDTIARSSPYFADAPADIMLFIRQPPTIWSIGAMSAEVSLSRETTYSTSYAYLTLAKK